MSTALVHEVGFFWTVCAGTKAHNVGFFLFGSEKGMLSFKPVGNEWICKWLMFTYNWRKRKWLSLGQTARIKIFFLFLFSHCRFHSSLHHLSPLLCETYMFLVCEHSSFVWCRKKNDKSCNISYENEYKMTSDLAQSRWNRCHLYHFVSIFFMDISCRSFS